MPEQLPEIPAHRAKDKFGKIAMHTAHDITEALAEAGVPDDGVVVVRTDGPHRSIGGLERLLDDVLADEDTTAGEASGTSQPENPAR